MQVLGDSKVTLIGPITCDPAESVGSVNESIMAGLKDEVHFVPHIATRAPGSTASGSMSLANGWVFLRHLGQWTICLAKHKPEVAHYAITSNWNMEKSLSLLWLAQLVGCKTIGHLHGGSFIEFWQNVHPVRRRIGMHVISRLDSFVVLSEGWKERVMETLNLPEDQVRVVYNPIDSDFERDSLNFPVTQGRDKVVLCFGVMDRKKGLFDILEAAATIPPDESLKFVLVGPEREPGIAAETAKFIQNHGLESRVEWVGPVHGARKLELFRTASLFLLPSYVENFPVTVLESMAAGVPVICTAVGAVPEFLVDGESALFVKPGAPKEIVVAVQRLMGDSKECARLSCAAREIFLNRLQRSQVMAQMMAVYDGLDTAC